ncbi:MAG TPA: hypothetical protein VGD99_03175 [Anaerolineae bacterium]|jgi:hypothetical protein
MIDALGNRIAYGYDAASNITFINDDPNSLGWEYTYAPLQPISPFLNNSNPIQT